MVLRRGMILLPPRYQDVPRCSTTVARQAIQWHQDFPRQLAPEARNLLLLVPPVVHEKREILMGKF